MLIACLLSAFLAMFSCNVYLILRYTKLLRHIRSLSLDADSLMLESFVYVYGYKYGFWEGTHRAGKPQMPSDEDIDNSWDNFKDKYSQ
jgi:hypothetical protein